MSTQVIGGTAAASTTNMANNVYVKISGAGMATPTTLTLTGGATKTVGDMVTQLQSDLSDSTNNPSLAASGISLSEVNGQYVFTNAKNQSFSVEVTGDTANSLGFGAYAAGSTPTADYSSITGSSYAAAVTNTTAGAAANLEFSVGGGPAIAIAPLSLAGGNATAANYTSSAISGTIAVQKN